MTEWPREIFIDITAYVRIRYGRSERLPFRYAVVLEARIEDIWTTIHLWDNAHGVEEHHEHEYTRSEGKRDLQLHKSSDGDSDDSSGTGLADNSRELEIAMTTRPEHLSPSAAKVIASIDDTRLDARYPNRTHFVDADNPDQALLTSRALFAGDPAVVVYPDGQEVLFTPERTSGLAGLLMLAALFWIKMREHSSAGELIQLPPRTRVEVRDSSGLHRAA